MKLTFLTTLVLAAFAIAGPLAPESNKDEVAKSDYRRRHGRHDYDDDDDDYYRRHGRGHRHRGGYGRHRYDDDDY
ncbi:hypothetical protein CYLTODRAFT_456177 [Cylindrobasidium torrendii FP15055 ss-10]|uniref:Uncharacterized protein n=1 Tax=Cylindrobasidium torrendii FP15055 ss-10 TaxID=1314674 RepID=A0A0D7B7T0_9AGAR|nr:hypothetical protein CYLTODRAFT_456177 [Cylindrobasidium torrendii FP15055 ss-10]